MSASLQRDIEIWATWETLGQPRPRCYGLKLNIFDVENALDLALVLEVAN